MKNTAKLKCQLTLTFFFIIGLGACNAQEVFNYDNVAANTPNGIINIEKIESILNSDSIVFTPNASTSRNTSFNETTNGITTLDINYSDLGQLNGMRNQNIKYCIVKITAPVSTINLNILNQFQNLEVVHIIIETPAISGNIKDLIVLNNPRVLISYQVSILQ
jgi:hypothetical protein